MMVMMSVIPAIAQFAVCSLLLAIRHAASDGHRERFMPARLKHLAKSQNRRTNQGECLVAGEADAAVASCARSDAAVQQRSRVRMRQTRRGAIGDASEGRLEQRERQRGWCMCGVDARQRQTVQQASERAAQRSKMRSDRCTTLDTGLGFAAAHGLRVDCHGPGGGPTHHVQADSVPSTR